MASYLADTGELERVGDAECGYGKDFLDHLVDTAVPSLASACARRVRDKASERRRKALAYELAEALNNGSPFDDVLERLTEMVHNASAGQLPDPDLDDVLAEPEPEYDWVIPGLLERGDRVLLTGPEGGGKSTLLRQLGIQAAAGVHPFTLEPIEPVRVLLIDLENPKRLIKRSLRKLRSKAGEMRRAHHVPILRPEGIDLCDPDDQAWLTERVEANQPELVLMGPHYRLYNGDSDKEEPARPVAAFLDRLRVRYGFALMMEAHTPHGQEIRPIGTSLWKRWPEFGLHLSAEGRLQHWRGARDDRDWPSALKRGGEWLWTADPSVHATPTAGLSPAERRVLEILECDPDRRRTVPQILDVVTYEQGQSLADRTIQLALKELGRRGLATVDDSGKPPRWKATRFRDSMVFSDTEDNEDA